MESKEWTKLATALEEAGYELRSFSPNQVGTGMPSLSSEASACSLTVVRKGSGDIKSDEWSGLAKALEGTGRVLQAANPQSPGLAREAGAVFSMTVADLPAEASA